MICSNCKQRTAVTVAKQKVGGIVREIYLCPECHLKLTTENLFSAFFSGAFSAKTPKAAPQRCPQCGTTGEQVAQSGFVGCENCYEIFADILLPYIEQIQGGGTHCGKQKGNSAAEPIADNERKKQELVLKIKQAVEQKKYLEAAKIQEELDKL